MGYKDSGYKICKRDDLRDYIESMVGEIILEDKPFGSYKDELRMRCEA